MEAKAGEILGGKYRLLGRLGQGGMGAVFEGEHINLRQPVAVKVLLPTYAKDPTLCKRFVLEAQAASRIEGEHVVRVFDVDQVEGTPFLVMERLDGESYADRLERAGVMSVLEVADALLQAMEALAQAHTLGIVHRDIKPGNLFAARLRDGREVVKVLDFGIASAFHGAENGSLTGKETILGSLPYMSPEHCKGARFATPQSDIWSLGITAYELVSGVTPFSGDTMVSMFNLILQTDAPSLSSKAPHVPAEFSDVIAKSLERDPKKRYGSILELARAFAPFATPELAKTMIPRIEGAVRTMTASGENVAAVYDDETLAKQTGDELPQFADSLVDSEPEPATKLLDTSAPGYGFDDPTTARHGAAGPYPSGPGIALGATMESGSHPGGIAGLPESLPAPQTPRMPLPPRPVSTGSDSFLHPIAGPTTPAAPARSWLIALGAAAAVVLVLLVVVVTRLRGRVDTADLPPPNDSAFSVSPPVPSSSVTLPSIVSTSVVVETSSSPSSSPSASGGSTAPSSQASSSSTGGRPRPRPSSTTAPAASGTSGWAKGRDGF